MEEQEKIYMTVTRRFNELLTVEGITSNKYELYESTPQTFDRTIDLAKYFKENPEICEAVIAPDERIAKAWAESNNTLDLMNNCRGTKVGATFKQYINLEKQDKLVEVDYNPTTFKGGIICTDEEQKTEYYRIRFQKYNKIALPDELSADEARIFYALVEQGYCIMMNNVA